MLFNVVGLIQDGIGATQWHRVDDNLLRDDGGVESVAGDVELLRTPDGILVRAHLQLEEPETCSRCLKPVEEKVRIDFEEEFLTPVDIQSGERLEDDEVADTFLIGDNHLLDLSEAVRQYREASVVMQPLCRPDCPGLCPKCGHDRSKGDCDCEPRLVDDRWAALQAFLPDQEGRN